MIPPQYAMPLLVSWILHLLVSLVYGLVVSLAASRFRQSKAFIAGAVAGLILYGLNLGVVSLCWPFLRGPELGVLLDHIVFGLIGAGAYRGLLKRRVFALPD
jgi:predicted membrane-bound spermidine synthase